VEQVSYEEFEKDSICGDGIYDKFTEECDSVPGCGNNCVCKEGYTSDGNGNCLMECIFGDRCLSGCRAPNMCEFCDVTKGYTRDCQNWQSFFLKFKTNLPNP
jgi:hypothetical protein